MIADRRYCVDILTQLRASTSALRSIEIEVLEAHVRACMKDAMSSKDSKSAERKLNELMDLLVRRGG